MKRKLLFIIEAFCSFFIFCETRELTELEKLFDFARKNSVELHSASFFVEKAELEYKNRRSLYPFSLKFGVDSSFNDVYEEVLWFPGSAKVNVSISKVNPFGNTVSGSISYGLARNVLDYFAETVDSENIGYSHAPEISFQVSQSLFPAFTGGISSGKIINPEAKILKNGVESAFYSKQESEQALFQTLCENYVRARCVLREIKKYGEYVDFYQRKISAAEELLFSGKISVSDLWVLESKKWEHYKNYLEAESFRENIFLQLRNLCGSSFAVEDSVFSVHEDAVFPDLDAFLFEKDLTKKRTLLELENLKIQYRLQNQNSAPFLIAGGNFSEQTKSQKEFLINYIEDKSVFAWSFTLGISFSEFLSPSRSMKDIFYRKNLDLYGEKIKQIEEEMENRRKNYRKIVELYEKQQTEMQDVLKKRKKLYSDYQELFKKGKCSALDLDEVHLSVIEAECIFASLRDYLWFYKWMEVQYK